MKGLFLFLVLLGIAFSSGYEETTIAFEKEWKVSGNASIINFTSVFLINNSNQEIENITALPPLEIVKDGDKFTVHYYGKFYGNATFRARAIAKIRYKTNITRDEPLPEKGISYGGVVEYNDEMAALAKNLSDANSSLESLANLANWVNENMEYDKSYTGAVLPAKKVFIGKRGVCTEYTHLFIALANSLGFKTRFVAGYAVEENDWEPHSWAEVYTSGQWIDFDPTFAQAGVLDNLHIAVSYGKDAEDIYESVMQSDGSVAVETKTKIDLLENEQAQNDVLEFYFDEKNRSALIKVKNPQDKYEIGSYSRILPKEYGGIEKKIIVLKPYGSYDEKYALEGDFKEGYRYTIPVILSFNNIEEKNNISVEIREGSGQGEEHLDNQEVCLPALVLLALIMFYFFKIGGTEI